ncbi:MAG: histidine--tRNA ligase [Rhodospirillaceae bacterium]|nr:histidine--tRNA ligase [Rhodospirillaceae bacterium]
MTSKKNNLQPVRGTQDILPEENRLHRYVESVALRITELYGFGEISTPLLEFTDVFSRTLGDTSDIVTKEMYTFRDRGGDCLTLRPEGTAGVARALISNGLAQNLPLKYFYRGPMFRYERPQKGRRRQFHQVGVEVLGVASSHADIEVIALAHHFLSALGLDHIITLELNTLGDLESRRSYRATLLNYLAVYKDDLSDDSRARLEKNPLRILDSKDEGDRHIIADAPLLKDSLNDASRHFFEDLQEGLVRLSIPYKLNDKLVRGMDYYCHTAFEFTSTDLGAQGTVLAGGRYDGLVSEMGGPVTPGIGWAAGVERLSMLVNTPPEEQRPIAVIPTGQDTTSDALMIAHQLRRKGFRVEYGYTGNVGKRLKRANAANACAAVILGDDEISRNVGLIRDMDSGKQTEVSMDLIDDFLSKFR